MAPSSNWLSGISRNHNAAINGVQNQTEPYEIALTRQWPPAAGFLNPIHWINRIDVRATPCRNGQIFHLTLTP